MSNSLTFQVIVVVIPLNLRDDWAFENAVIVDVLVFVNKMRTLKRTDTHSDLKN